MQFLAFFFLRCLIMRELAHKYSIDLDSVDEQRLNRLTVSVTLYQRVLHWTKCNLSSYVVHCECELLLPSICDTAVIVAASPRNSHAIGC